MLSFAESFDRSLAKGNDFAVNDKIVIHIPTVDEIIEYGEQQYYKIIYGFAATSSDYKAQLDDEGLDWQNVSDYEMFIRLFLSMRNADLSIVFNNLDCSKLEFAFDNEIQEYVFIDEENDVRIDRTVYEVISAFICAMHSIEKIHEKASDEPTRIAMIEEARDEIEINKNKPYEPHLRYMACAMANTPEFKADYFQSLQYPICVFMDCVRQVQQNKRFNYTMQGIYAGTIDMKKVPKSQLVWLKKAE